MSVSSLFAEEYRLLRHAQQVPANELHGSTPTQHLTFAQLLLHR